MVNASSDSCEIPTMRRSSHRVRSLSTTLKNGEYELFGEEMGVLAYQARWAPDQRRFLLGTGDGIELFDPDTGERRMLVPNPTKSNQTYRVTSNGYVYYSVERNERDIWIARREAARELEAFGATDE